METLFEEQGTIETNKTCNTCKHRQRWNVGSDKGPERIMQYCGAIKSNRTNNGLQKIKCKNKACGLYKEAVNSA